MMTQFDDNTFSYNLNGIRYSKNDIQYALSGIMKGKSKLNIFMH